LALSFGRICLTPVEAVSFAGEILGDPEHDAEPYRSRLVCLLRLFLVLVVRA